MWDLRRGLYGVVLVCLALKGESCRCNFNLLFTTIY